MLHKTVKTVAMDPEVLAMVLHPDTRTARCVRVVSLGGRVLAALPPGSGYGVDDTPYLGALVEGFVLSQRPTPGNVQEALLTASWEGRSTLPPTVDWGGY